VRHNALFLGTACSHVTGTIHSRRSCPSCFTPSPTDW
jgi:hypothetical protein